MFRFEQADGFVVAKRAALACMAYFVVLGVAAEAQVVFRTEARLVEVPVVVRDKKTGKPAEGLKASDFVVLEDGKPQKIELFSVYKTGEKTVSKLQKPLDRVVFHNRRDTPEVGTPVVAVLIDGFNARYEDQYYAAQAAAAVIEKSEEKALWGMYFLGFRGIRVLHDYSTNTESVVDRLRKLRSAGDSAEGLGAEAMDVPHIQLSGYVDERFGRLPSFEAQRRAILTLEALRGIARHLSALPGRKSLIWMTAGLPLTGVVSGMPELWRTTVETLNAANVAVYSIDSEGVRTARGFRADVPAARGVSLRQGLGSPIANSQVLLAVSNETGGRWFINTNDLEKATEESLDDAKVFYTLAYRVVTQKREGSEVKLEVKAPGLKGVEIRHRASYRVRPAKQIEAEERDRLLADAIVSPLEAIEIGMLGRISAADSSGDRVLDLTMEPGAVTLEEAGAQYGGRLDVRCVQASAEGKVVDDFTDELSLNLKADEAKRVHNDGVHYQRPIRLKPGAHVLKIAVCDQATGRVGSLRIELPEAKQRSEE